MTRPAAPKPPPPPLWGPALTHLHAGGKLNETCHAALPGLTWAGWVELRDGVHQLTERGEATLKHLQRRRRWPSEEELNRALLDAPSLPGPTQGAPQRETTPQDHPPYLSAAARLVEEYGFRMEPAGHGAARVIPPRGAGYGTLDFDDRGELVCCAWELSRRHRNRIVDLASGVSKAQLVTWLRWGREAARYAAACTPRRAGELLQAAGLRFHLRTNDDSWGSIHPTTPGSPEVARYRIQTGCYTHLVWLEPWGHAHNYAHPDGATEADVAAWLAPWTERQQQAPMASEAPSMADQLAGIGCELTLHIQRSFRCADRFEHYEVRRGDAVVTRVCWGSATWWLLEGQKRRSITPAELVEHLSAPPAPQPPPLEEPAWSGACLIDLLATAPPVPFVDALRDLARAEERGLIVERDATRQAKAPGAVECWKIATPGYQGGRIIVRVEEWPDGYDITCGAKGAKQHINSRAAAMEIVRAELVKGRASA